MTGGQTALSLGGNQSNNKDSGGSGNEIRRLVTTRRPLPVIRVSEAELEQHNEKLASIHKASADNCIWLKEPVAEV
jgi:DNA polymerase-3 subunit epsilon